MAEPSATKPVERRSEDGSDGTGETGSLEDSTPSSSDTASKPQQLTEEDPTTSELLLEAAGDVEFSVGGEERKSVSFSQIEIREYGVTLGDHPGTGLGPPVTIEWDHHTEHVLHVDEYEKGYGDEKRRKGVELRMPKDVREKMLTKSHSAAELRQAQRAAGRVRANRSVAVAMNDLEHFEILFQSAARKFKRWRKRRSGAELEPAEAWIEEMKQAKKDDSTSNKTHVRSKSDPGVGTAGIVKRIQEETSTTTSSRANSLSAL